MSRRTLAVAALVAAPILPLASTTHASQAPVHLSAHQIHLIADANRRARAAWAHAIAVANREARARAATAAARAAATARARVVEAAEHYIGQWYSYGNLDCSGLTQRAYAAIGRRLPRTAAAQGVAGHATTTPRPGDLVAWGTPAYHMAIYIGRGRAVVARHSGTRVEIQAIWGSPRYRAVLT